MCLDKSYLQGAVTCFGPPLQATPDARAAALQVAATPLDGSESTPQKASSSLCRKRRIKPRSSGQTVPNVCVRAPFSPQSGPQEFFTSQYLSAPFLRYS